MKTLKFIQNARSPQEMLSDRPKRADSVRSLQLDNLKQVSPKLEEVRKAPKPHPKPSKNSSKSPSSRNVPLTENELAELVIREAQNSCVEDYVSLVHLLNTFDVVIKDLNPKPQPDIAN